MRRRKPFTYQLIAEREDFPGGVAFLDPYPVTDQGRAIGAAIERLGLRPGDTATVAHQDGELVVTTPYGEARLVLLLGPFAPPPAEGTARRPYWKPPIPGQPPVSGWWSEKALDHVPACTPPRHAKRGYVVFRFMSGNGKVLPQYDTDLIPIPEDEEERRRLRELSGFGSGRERGDTKKTPLQFIFPALYSPSFAPPRVYPNTLVYAFHGTEVLGVSTVFPRGKRA